MRLVEQGGYDEFGFWIVRLDYSDEDAWERWSDLIDDPIDHDLAKCLGGERLLDKLQLPRVEDEDLEGTGLHGAVWCVPLNHSAICYYCAACHIDNH